MQPDEIRSEIPRAAVAGAVVIVALPAAVRLLLNVPESVSLFAWVAGLAPVLVLALFRGLMGALIGAAASLVVILAGEALLSALDRPTTTLTYQASQAVVLAGVSLAIGMIAQRLHQEREAAAAAALVDQLTGLPNRRHAELVLTQQFAAASRGAQLCVILFDLDRFKQINDRHGHKAGDETLRAFAGVLAGHTRRMNLSARFGGEEFLSVALAATAAGAAVFAERVRAELEQRPFPWGPVTVSCGVAQYEDGMGSWEVLVAAADRALYQAKSSGRNRVHTAALAGNRAAAEPAAPAAVRARRERLVVCDDEVVTLRGLVALLERAGFEVEGTSDPQRVLELFRAEPPPDLLVTDVMMPKMNGLILAAEATRLRPGLRVVYVTGYIQKEVTWAGLPGAAVALIQKPVEAARLVATVREVLARVI
jgi:diguanylate cyclase (GGDEF)-like protein